MIINEIFTSIDGEVNPFHQGTMSLFVRLAGCNLRCPYCDTKYAQGDSQGEKWQIMTLVNAIRENGCHKIIFTGGEPLLQKSELVPIINVLLSEGFKVTVETNGSICLPENIIQNGNFGWVVDYKLWCWENMETNNYLILSETDWVKFVLQSKNEYHLARQTIDILRNKGCQARMALSPVFGNEDFTPADLILMIKNDRFWDVTVNIQLHKIIWDFEKRGV